MHLRDNKFKDLNLTNIALAGNGSQFFRYFTLGEPPRSSTKFLAPYIKLMLSMIEDGRGEKMAANCNVMFTDNPKFEVAYGLLFADTTKAYTSNKTDVKMLGLDVKVQNNSYYWNQWPEENKNQKITAEQFANGSINYDQFKQFIQCFYGAIEKDEYLKNKIIGRHFDEVAGFESHFIGFVSQGQSKPLVTPLFFSAVKTWLDLINPSK
jgi:hypothetical protein